MELKHLKRLALAALALGWIFDFFFWGHEPGITFFLYTLLCVAAGLGLAWGAGVRPARASLWLLAPVTLLAGATFVRREPLTVAISAGLALVGLALLALTLRSGAWSCYSLADLVAGGLRLVREVLVGGARVWSALRRPAAGAAVPSEGAPAVEDGDASPAAEAPERRLEIRPWAVVRGLLLAVPALLVLGSLLAAADPIFGQALRDFLAIFRLERWAEYAFRLSYILIGAYALAGIFAYALTRSQRRDLIGVEKPWLPPFLGWTEAVIVLAAVEALFAAFVVVQVRYFFGGQANIHLEGFTYAEYARRGFGELVTVALLSLGLFLALSAVTRRAAGAQQRIFSGLGIALVGLVAVMLVSAYQRLLLYEGAYGFTRIRTDAHVFMVWLGILLAVTVTLELTGQQRGFALALLGAAAGFGLTLGALNVDALIVRQNVARAAAGSPLDAVYLSTLSDDALPTLAAEFTAADGPVRDALGAVLACRAWRQAQGSREAVWQAFHLSTYRAERTLESLRASLDAYPVSVDADGLAGVRLENDAVRCGWAAARD